MNQITSNWRKFLLKEAQEHHEVEMIVKYSPDMSLYGDVFNQIRAIPGVTIIKKKQNTQIRQAGQQKLIILNLKFIPPRESSTRGFLSMLRTELLRIKDESGERILGINFITNPQAISKQKALS